MKPIDNVLVIKVGTSTLLQKNDDGSEQLDKVSYERIGKQVLALQDQGFHIVLVSSGAITAGMVAKGITTRPSKDAAMASLQHLASIGWHHVLNAWSDVLGSNKVGGLLLTQSELGLNKERDEAMRVLYEHMSQGDIAVANENDAITHEEIAFGDNDSLAAALAVQLSSSPLFGSNIRLILLSDVDGVYADKHNASSIIKSIDSVENFRHLAGDAGSPSGTGGMATKFEAADLAGQHGIDMWIANGIEENVIKRALDGEIGTHFISSN